MAIRQKGRKAWEPQDHWYSVAYKEFRDSREWRYLLELNPSYDIRYHPAPTVPINTRGFIGTDKEAPSGGGGAGFLKNPDLNLEMLIQTADVVDSRQPSYFPWSSADAYLDRLGDYTASALLTADRTNGYSFDSPQTQSDSQRG